ncbi:MAG: hypothetical protein AABZ08_00720 [Planctomycetota bacterium]
MTRFITSRWGKWTLLTVGVAFGSILPGQCTNMILRFATPFLI